VSAVEESPRTAYAYEAQTIDGQRFKGTLEAASAEDVQAKLAALQLRILSVDPTAAPPRARRGILGADDFLVFNQQLAHLTQAGLPVERGLRLIALDMRSGALAKAAEEVARELEAGTPLQEAFSHHAARFPALYGKLVDAGAAAGNLPGMLFNMGRHLELVTRLRQALWRTLAYPLVVLAALSLVMLLISLYVLPRFEEIYLQFRLEPPLITRTMMVLGHVYPWIFTVVAALVILLFGVLIIRHILGLEGHAGEAILRRIPLIGGVLRASLLARWIDALRLSIEAGLDLPRALQLAAEATGSVPLTREAAGLAAIVQQGRPLSTYQGRLIPATVPAAMELAASTGDLPAALYTLCRMYEQQAEHRLRILPNILMPLLMLFVGGAIALCIGALFAPLLQYIRLLSSDFYF